MEMKFYRCKRCGQMVAMVDKKTCPVINTNCKDSLNECYAAMISRMI